MKISTVTIACISFGIAFPLLVMKLHELAEQEPDSVVHSVTKETNLTNKRSK